MIMRIMRTAQLRLAPIVGAFFSKKLEIFQRQSEINMFVIVKDFCKSTPANLQNIFSKKVNPVAKDNKYFARSVSIWRSSPQVCSPKSKEKSGSPQVPRHPIFPRYPVCRAANNWRFIFFPVSAPKCDGPPSQI